MNNNVPAKIDKMLYEINDIVINTIAERIKKVSKLTDYESSQLINLMRFYGEDLQSIEKKLSKLSKKTIAEVRKIMRESAIDISKEVIVQFDKKAEMSEAAKAIMNNAIIGTTADLMNLSDTSALWIGGKPLRESYIEIIDKSIIALRSGVTDINTVLARSMNKIGNGVKVQYMSGHLRRIDSAMRMNILDGLRRMNREVRKEQAGEFGADGVYIMPHALCAPDHLPYQGKEYTYDEFDALNAELKRPIATGQWNCGHIAYDRVLGDLLPYSREELADINSYGSEKTTWNGKKMTRYEASQKMRAAETRIRELKLKLQAYKKSNDKTSTLRYNEFVAEAKKKYLTRCKECGLRPHYNLI